MSKRQRFGISQSLQQGLSETINAVKNNAGSVRFEVVNLFRIETDPQNPRELRISAEEIRSGINISTPDYEVKKQELEKLQPLAETIRQKGLINPVVVYKHGEKYRLVAGERRFLSSILAGKEDIQARILNEKPGGLDLRLLQWIENTEREDLSLKDRIGNVKAIVHEYLKGKQTQEPNVEMIKELIGVSLPQAFHYLAVLNMPIDLEEQVMQGNINNLDKAAFIAKIGSKSLRDKAITSCVKGDNLKAIRQLVEDEKKLSNPVVTLPSKISKSGRALTRINLGTTTKPNIVQKIVLTVLKDPQFKRIEASFSGINWAEYKEATQAFRRFLSFLEREDV